MKNYQSNYASTRPQMYDEKSRKNRALRIIKTLEDYYGDSYKLSELTALDVGASTGIIDKHLAPHFKQMVGIDIDGDGIIFAKKNNKLKNLVFKKDDAMKLSFPKHSFDVVICTQVYEHVPNSAKMFKEIHRVLRPGGVCYLAALNRLWPWEPHYNLLFLSWFPKPLANIYLRILRGKKEYYETTATYWGLLKLTSMFKQTDYTSKILRNPKNFGYTNIPALISPFSPILAYFTPTFFWILKK